MTSWCCQRPINVRAKPGKFKHEQCKGNIFQTQALGTGKKSDSESVLSSWARSKSAGSSSPWSQARSTMPETARLGLWDICFTIAMKSYL